MRAVSYKEARSPADPRTARNPNRLTALGPRGDYECSAGGRSAKRQMTRAASLHSWVDFTWTRGRGFARTMPMCGSVNPATI